MGSRKAQATVAVLAAVAGFSDSGDLAGLRDELNRSIGILGLGCCIDEVVMPSLRRVGERWRAGLCSIDTERRTTETIRGWLEALALTAPEPHAGIRPVVLACGPSDRHTVALEALGVLLRHQRQSCRVLGARTTVRAMSIAVMANQPRAVVIACHLGSAQPAAAQLLREVATFGPTLFYAGNGFASAAQRLDVPGTYLGTDLRSACDQIVNS
jgi:MerR family transcriptional regulator, light-induced transcriptional regulator